jgi:hypothetical protein
MKTLSACLAAVVMAASLAAAPVACDASNSKCMMGCGMEMSSGGCCCQIDQQNSGSQPAKTALNVLPMSPKFSPPNGVFACEDFRAVSAPGIVLHHAADLPSARGGLAFLGVFLI